MQTKSYFIIGHNYLISRLIERLTKAFSSQEQGPVSSQGPKYLAYKEPGDDTLYKIMLEKRKMDSKRYSLAADVTWEGPDNLPGTLENILLDNHFEEVIFKTD